MFHETTIYALTPEIHSYLGCISEIRLFVLSHNGREKPTPQKHGTATYSFVVIRKVQNTTIASPLISDGAASILCTDSVQLDFVLEI